MTTNEARSVERPTSIEKHSSPIHFPSESSNKPLETISVKARDEDTSPNQSLTNLIADYKLKYRSENVLGRGHCERDTWQGPDTATVTIDDFEVVQSLGRGTFGKVVKVRRKTNGDEFAVKLVPINTCLHQREEDNLNSESEIFKTISSHFVVKAYYWYFSLFAYCDIAVSVIVSESN